MSERERTPNGTASGSPGEAWQEERLRALFVAADVPVSASDALRQRVAQVTAASEAPSRRRRTRWKPLRLGLGLAAAMTLALVYMVVAPMWVAAQVLGRAEAAEGAVWNAHMIVWRLWPDGRRTKVSEAWYQGEAYREVDLSEGRVTVQSGDRLWTYEPKLNKVTVRRWKPRQFEASDYSLRGILRAGRRSGKVARFLGEAVLNGRPVHRIAQWLGDRNRTLMLVDVATDLPVRAEAQVEREGRWVTELIYEPRYNEAMAADLFRPDFPKSAQVYDRDQGRQQWQRRLSRGIVRESAGGRTIVIRDAQVNAEGDLFLLYTAGKFPTDKLRTEGYLGGRDWDVEVTDEFGTVYLWQGRYGNWAWNLDTSSPHRQGWAIDGERLEGDWWVALEPQVPWKPRQITVTFRVPPVNLHGSARVKKPYTETATLTLPLEHPTTTLLPDYMTHLAIGLQEQDVPIARARARGSYYELGLPDRLDFVKPDLPRALEYHHEALRLREQRAKETGQPAFSPETWMDVGRVLRKMGRLQEARAAFQRAIRETVSPGHEREMAQAALEAVEGEIAWQPGRTAPSFRATDLQGQRQSPLQYRGQVLLIHLWHAWDDKEGREDLPLVADLYRKHREQGLAVLGIGIHFQMPKLLKVVEQHRLTWPQICDGQGWQGKLHRQFGTPTVPHTILIDRQGTIRAAGLHGPALRKAVAELVTAR